MPSNIVKSFASKIGKSEDEVEKLWNKAKVAVTKEYPNVENDSEQYYKIVTGVLKKMLKLEETPSVTTTSANVGAGQGGSFRRRMSTTNCRKDKKRSSVSINDFVGK